MIKTPRRTLTDTFVRSLKPAAAGKRLYYYDLKTPDFGVAVTDTGHRSYLIYKRIGKVPTRRIVGDCSKMSLAKARALAKQWIEVIEAGGDPAAEAKVAEEAAATAKAEADAKLKAAVTFGDAVERWLAAKVRGQHRRGREVELNLKREFFPLWGDTPIAAIERDHVRDAIENIAADRPAAARNCLTYLKLMFAWASDRNDFAMKVDVVAGLKAKNLFGKKLPRQHVLSDIELRVFWRVTAHMEYPYGPLLQLLLLTGQRRSDIACARWREIDLEKRNLTVPAERYKTNVTHLVPLSADAMEILTSLPRFARGDYIFSTTFGLKPVGGFSKIKRRLDAEMAADMGAPPPHWVLHDLRRTCRTHLSALPISDVVKELMIGHTQTGVRKVYDLFAYQEEKRTGFELWSTRLRGIVDRQPADTNFAPVPQVATP